MVLLRQYPIRGGPESGSRHVHHAVYTMDTDLVVKQEVFDDAADDVRFVPVHSTPVLDRFGSSMV